MLMRNKSKSVKQVQNPVFGSLSSSAKFIVLTHFLPNITHFLPSIPRSPSQAVSLILTNQSSITPPTTSIPTNQASLLPQKASLPLINHSLAVYHQTSLLAVHQQASPSPTNQASLLLGKISNTGF